MPEVGLGIGCEQGSHEGYTREWLYWYNQQGDRLKLEQERQIREELRDRLRHRGINLDNL